MPSVDNWQEQPLSRVDSIFEKRNDDSWINEVHKEFEARLKSLESISAVPSLNDSAAHELQPNSLVRFRCMIQDHFDNEFFMHTYDLIDKEKSVTVQKTSCFQDVVGCPPNCEIDANPSKSKTGMRQVLYCVSVPGETEWVKKVWRAGHSAKPNKVQVGPQVSSKRERDEDDEMITEDTPTTSDGQDSSKKSKPSAETSSQGSKEKSGQSFGKNHPLSNEDGPVCLVKVYNESEFKVNEVYEFYGVLSVDPGLSCTYDSAGGDDGIGTSDMDTGDLEENRAHHPPASLVPRLHVVAMKKLEHNNPLLPRDVTPQFLEEVKEDASSVRSSLLALLEKATLGDSLAAEYLLLHLISRVYARRDMLAIALGKFSLNISGIPPNSSYPRILSHFLAELVSKLHYLPMSIEKLNALRFIPCKNYNTNRLDTGILQLSEGTHLILDETTLKPGRMDANGVKNIQALKDVLSFQKVNYNFQFHEAPFKCDIGVLILSEGKSLLPCDSQIELKPQDGFPENMEEYFATFCSKCPAEFLDSARKYISSMRLLDYQLPESMTEEIQNHFVAARREDSKFGADDLHAWLDLARLMSISVGQQSLTPQRWERVKALEVRRKERLPVNRNADAQNGH